MKKFLLPAFVVVITIFATLIMSNVIEDEPSSDAIRIRLYSSILKEDRDAYIRLPRDYDSTKSYPILYALDATSLDTQIANDLTVLSDAGVVPNAIVVGIPNMTSENRESNLVPPFMLQDHEDDNSPVGNADQFLNFIESELIPFIEKTYPSSSRAFFGNSRGGLTVMYSLIDKPSLFDARFCFSTPFWRQDGILIDSVQSFMRRDSTSSFIFLSAGKNETENIRKGHEQMTIVLEEKKGLIVESSVTDGATHGNNASISIPFALRRWKDVANRR